MNQDGEPTVGTWKVRSPSPAPVASEVGYDGFAEELEIIKLNSDPFTDQTMGDSIRVSSPSLPSASMDPSIPRFNAFESNPMEPLAYSPAYSSSSLSDPPTEPNSPILFNVNGILRLEDAEDNFDISSEVANYTPLDSPTMNRTPPGLGARARVSGDRKIDPCADEGWVAALRVAHAADQTVGLSDDLSITHVRNLRKTPGRLIRVKNTFSAAGSPLSSTSLNGSPVDSKKRRRSNTRTHSNNIAPDGVSMAIKKEMLETGDGIGIDDSIPISPRTGERRKRKTPMKKQKIDSTPETIPGLAPMPYDPRSNEEGITTSLAVDGTTPSEKRKKRPRRLTYAYVIEEVVENQPDDGTRGSVPPNFTFRYDIPHAPLWIGKEPLRSSRYWSEGAEGPRNSKPIGDVFQRKDGLLTDFVSIIESRLRPRKSTGNPPAGRDSETEENSDDLTVTEDEDGTDDDLDIDGESIALSGIEGGEHGLENSSLKRQKLNTGESSSTGASRETPRNKNKNKEPTVITDIKDADERTWPGAISMVDGRCMVPASCTNCKEARQFCDRNFPCSRCTTRHKDCSRSPGLIPAKPRGRRRTRGQTSGNDAIYLQSPQLVEASLELQQQPKRRRRPQKPLIGPTRLWPKKEVMNKVKKEKDTKEVINLIDPQEGKPPGIRKPEVWCESRQELCESLPYYRSYQSGCYGHDGLVHGYLLDGFAAPRDYVDGKVVISHSGGKSTADEDGQRRLLTNQTPEDKVIKYLLTNMKNQLPLVMIMGTQCTSSPSKLPHRYCVMDWFKVTAGWAERDPRSRYTRWKFRFEKLDTAVDGWWAASPTAEYDTSVEMVKATCSTCKTESPHVYEEGWMCLKPECAMFWILNGEDAPVDIKYTDNFLRCRTSWPAEFLTPPSPLGPPLNFNRDIFFDGGDVSRVFWKGMCCPKCGRLNCREVWAGWRCLSCDFTFDPPRTIFDATRLADPHRPVFTGPAIPANICHDDITYMRYVRDGMTVIQYQLGDCGTVTHILANQKTNARSMDADWLFREYQSAGMPFKRFALGNHKAQGRLLTQQFTFNCGAPYKFIVDVESHPFDKSPPVVSRALEVIHDRVNLVHPESQFNEVLNVGYFEKQKMDYHDDGEAGLGETVASISLGAPARMRFRVKARHARERHCWTTRPATPPQHRPIEFHPKEEPKNDEGLEPGDEEEDEDPERNEEVLGGQQPSSPQGRSPKKLSKGRVKLDLCLSHGDVMVMKGRDIQKYWEHSVIPQGLFRIAATARLITENHPGVLNKVKAEAAGTTEAEELIEASGEGEKKPEEEQKLSSCLQGGVSTDFEETIILTKPASLEPTEHLEIAPIQTVSVGIVGNRPTGGSPHDSSNEIRPRTRQPEPSDFDRMDSIPKPSSTAHQNADQNRQPWEVSKSPNGEKDGNKPLPNFALEHPVTLAADRIPHEVPGPSNDGMDMIPGLQYNCPPCSNGRGVTLPDAESGLCSSTNMARNPFSGPAPMLPQLSIGVSGALSQGPPRFGTANILHPVDQPVSPNNISFPHHIPETFPVNPQQLLQDPFDERGSTSEQLMPIIPNATKIPRRIPGLTTLWPEMGVPTGQKISEDPNEMSNV